MKNRIYLRKLPAYQAIPEKQEKYLSKDCNYDLGLLPTQGLQKELLGFILYRSEQVAISTLYGERAEYGLLCRFLTEYAQGVQSVLEKGREEWNRLLRIWMMKEGIPLVYEDRCRYKNTHCRPSRLIFYLKSVLDYLEPKDMRPELEKDVWELDKLDVEVRNNPIKRCRTIDFTRIKQTGIRDELKKGIYLNLQFESIACVKRELTAMRRLSAYLEERYPQTQSCRDIHREQIEEYLIYLNTEVTETKHFHSEINRLRAILDSIAKVCDYSSLTELFLQRDIPSAPKAEFKTYSDAEMRRLNAALVKLDEQDARLMIIHQRLVRGFPIR